MRIYPAIDIKDGKCVRLRQGRFDDVTVFSDDPLSMAQKWAACGASFLHLVDLDGAREGQSKNRAVLLKIAQELSIPVQVGGGVRTMETVADYLSAGVHRVILGTSAVKDRAFTEAALNRYGDRVVIGIDAKDGRVALSGWEEVGDETAVSFAQEMVALGAKTIIYTDIATDGMLQGPNLPAMREMASAAGCDVIASGGVSCLADLLALKKTGVAGAIVGRALYEGRVDLSEAIAAGEGE